MPGSKAHSGGGSARQDSAGTPPDGCHDPDVGVVDEGGRNDHAGKRARQRPRTQPGADGPVEVRVVADAQSAARTGKTPIELAPSGSHDRIVGTDTGAEWPRCGICG